MGFGHFSNNAFELISISLKSKWPRKIKSGQLKLNMTKRIQNIGKNSLLNKRQKKFKKTHQVEDDIIEETKKIIIKLETNQATHRKKKVQNEKKK
ncbi:Uncharacterized protein FWK35_00024902 [Aphis craccivora]|uniref:Uncharacterized protein n=1 Tax=Aphis craccivora TaxID=307492 RepID=A0A6G0Y3C8_APHCR|nr:Uncharacterized protein FWK35_00024902 [Aphis craccivora]